MRVVAHSLGSVIALSALEGRESGPEVDLTTMGSPLMLLAQRLPRAYGRARADGGHRNLPTVTRWRNFFFDQDLIGRALDPWLWRAGSDSRTFRSAITLGDGTHTDYFPDRGFAAEFLSD